MVVGTYNWAMTVFVAAHHGVPAGKRAIAVAGLLLAGVIAVVVLLWAKWLPYAAKATGVANSHAWVGSNILAVGGSPRVTRPRCTRRSPSPRPMDWRCGKRWWRHC